MPWKVIRRRLGRAGGERERTARQREWDRKYGEGLWAIGYVIEGEFVLQEDANERIYIRSYEAHFDAHPADLDELIRTAKVLRNPHALATTGVDLQVPAILEVLRRRNLTLLGNEVVDIGSWQGQASHPLSIRLSPLHIAVVDDPDTTLERFWQERKCLAIWSDENEDPGDEDESSR
jgi:hypothetical protein